MGWGAVRVAVLLGLVSLFRVSGYSLGMVYVGVLLELNPPTGVPLGMMYVVLRHGTF